jgi:hypothetical protein
VKECDQVVDFITVHVDAVELRIECAHGGGAAVAVVAASPAAIDFEDEAAQGFLVRPVPECRPSRIPGDGKAYALEGALDDVMKDPTTSTLTPEEIEVGMPSRIGA